MIFDVTMPIEAGMITWPGDPEVSIQRHEEGGFYVSRLCMGTHSGTHVDPPRHVDAQAPGADSIPLEPCLGASYLVDMSGLQKVTAGDLERASIPPDTARLLLKTDNSRWLGTERSFRHEFVALTPDAAEWLVSHRMKLIGIDGYSIEPYDGDGTVHRILLRSGIVVVENLLLGSVPEGPYDLICLPLKLMDGDGAPARVVLVAH